MSLKIMIFVSWGADYFGNTFDRYRASIFTGAELTDCEVVLRLREKHFLCMKANVEQIWMAEQVTHQWTYAKCMLRSKYYNVECKQGCEIKWEICFSLVTFLVVSHSQFFYSLRPTFLQLVFTRLLSWTAVLWEQLSPSEARKWKAAAITGCGC